MNSGNDDFASEGISFGENKGGDWRIGLGKDLSSDQQAMVSRHEMAHTMMHGSTSYGLLCLLFADLQNRLPQLKEHYKPRYDFLITKATIAHEMFAVWNSVAPFREVHGQAYANLLIQGYDEYLDFYVMAERFCPPIPGYFFVDLSVIGCLMYCFQGKCIMDTVVQDIDSFNDQCELYNDFPDTRLNYLLQHFDGNEFAEKMEATLSSCPDEGLGMFLKQVYNDTVDKTSQQYTEFPEAIRISLLDFTLKYLDDKFGSTLGPSINMESFWSYRKKLIELVDKKVLDAGQENFINRNRPAYHSSEKETLRMFESEAITLSLQKRECSIVFPYMLDAAYWKDIFVYYEQDVHVLIQVLTSRHILEQYDLLYPEQREWLEEREFVTCIRLIMRQSDGQLHVMVIPFESPEEMEECLSQKPADISIYGAIRLDALFNKSWVSNWRSYLEEVCASSFYINDTSLYFMLEDYYTGCKYVHYAEMNFSEWGKPIIALFIQSEEHDGTQLNTITLCSEMHGRTALHCLEKHYERYLYIEDLPEELQMAVARITGHILAEEQILKFN